MLKLLDIRRRTILFACAIVGLVAVVALTLSVRTNSQQMKVLNQKDKGELLKQVENSADIPFNVVENDDTPFRITEAVVKEISGNDFTKLTGKTTDLITVSSFPEVNLVNTSEKTITSFMIIVRNPIAKNIRGFLQSKVSVAPGQSYTVKREHFARQKQETIADKDGVRQSQIQPKFDSEKFWVDFEKTLEVFVTVADVTFEDGSNWKVGEGGKVK